MLPAAGHICGNFCGVEKLVTLILFILILLFVALYDLQEEL